MSTSHPNELTLISLVFLASDLNREIIFLFPDMYDEKKEGKTHFESIIQRGIATNNYVFLIFLYIPEKDILFNRIPFSIASLIYSINYSYIKLITSNYRLFRKLYRSFP